MRKRHFSGIVHKAQLTSIIGDESISIRKCLPHDVSMCVVGDNETRVREVVNAQELHVLSPCEEIFSSEDLQEKLVKFRLSINEKINPHQRGV